jgi:tetratricopeptide (TPR) repeat protein
MIKVIILIFLSMNLISSTITVNMARDEGKTFSTIHIISESDIACYKRINSDFKDEIRCEFNRAIKSIINSPENLYFKIESDSKSISITSKYKTNLYPIPNDFITKDKIYTKRNGKYKHWVVIGYKDLPVSYEINQNIDLNFPIEYKKNNSPYIGALNLDEKPLQNDKEVTLMSNIRDSFKNKKYDMTLSYCDKMLNSKNSSYQNDASLYKIRVLNEFVLNDNNKVDLQELIGMVEDWIEDNPSEKEIPQMLYIMSNAYIKKGRSNKAIEIISLLKSEYKDNYFTNIARINLADSMLDKLKLKKARQIYESIFYSTKDIDIASIAATKLTKFYLDKNENKKAKEIYLKIIKANNNYINMHIEQAYNIAKDFSDSGDKNMSLNIAQVFDNKNIDRFLNREEVEKNIAFWYENRNKDRSITLYRKYLKKYPNGSFVSFVKERLDALMIDNIQGDSSSKLAYYDSLMKKYPNSDIYKKSLLKKVDLLMESKKYEDILKLKDDLKKYGGESFLNQVAKIMLKKSLNKNDCKDALSIINEYNITAQKWDDEKLFNCYLSYSRYKKADELCEKYLKDKSLSQNILWLYNKAKVMNAQEKYEEVIKISKDIEKLSKILNTKEYKDIIYLQANAYYHLKSNYGIEFIKSVSKIENSFRYDVRNLDIYEKAIKYAKSKRDDLMILKYVKKIISAQNRANISLYSPRVEIDQITALKNIGQNKKALKENIKLLYRKLTDTQKANVLYLAGDLSLKLNKKPEAKEFFIKCGKIVEDNAWQKLCADSLRIIE